MAGSQTNYYRVDMGMSLSIYSSFESQIDKAKKIIIQHSNLLIVSII